MAHAKKSKPLQKPVTKTLTGLVGTYRGFYPTDEECKAGEIEITISAEKITARTATGSDRETYPYRYRMAVSDFVRMPAAEITVYVPNAKAVGFEPTSRKFPKFLFVENPGNIAGLLFFHEDNVLPAALLFTPDQVANGAFDRALAIVEAKLGKESMFRLHNDGKVKK